MNKIRVQNLQKLIDEKFNSWNKLAAAVGKEASYINGVKNDKRPFTEKLAREIEQKLGLPNGYLDTIERNEAANDEVFFFPEYDIKMSAGSGCEITNEEVIRQIPLLKSEFRMLGIGEQGVVVFTVDGESMLNSLVSGEKVLVDTKSNLPIDNRIFAICIDNTVLIKRLFIDPTTSNILVTSDNDSYKRFDFVANEETKILGLAIHTLGRKLI